MLQWFRPVWIECWNGLRRRFPAGGVRQRVGQGSGWRNQRRAESRRCKRHAARREPCWKNRPISGKETRKPLQNYTMHWRASFRSVGQKVTDASAVRDSRPSRQRVGRLTKNLLQAPVSLAWRPPQPVQQPARAACPLTARRARRACVRVHGSGVGAAVTQLALGRHCGRPAPRPGEGWASHRLGAWTGRHS